MHPHGTRISHPLPTRRFRASSEKATSTGVLSASVPKVPAPIFLTACSTLIPYPPPRILVAATEVAPVSWTPILLGGRRSIRDAEDETTVRGGVPATDGRPGSVRTCAGGPGSRVRAVVPGDPNLGRAGGPRCGASAATGLRTEEREELRRLRRENRRLREEREILAKATAWFAREPDPGDLPGHERESGSFPCRHDGPGARCLPERVLRVASSSSVGSGTGRCRAPGSRPGDSRPESRDVWCSSDSRRTDQRAVSR